MKRRIILTLCIAAAACSERSSDQLGSVHVISQDVTAAKGAILEVLPTDSAELAGAKVVIPAGALENTTKITIGFGEKAIFDDGAEIGPAVELGPPGTQFMKPVEVVIPVREAVDIDRLRIYVRQPNGTEEVILPYEINYDEAAGTASAYVTHFTTFQGGRASNACSHVSCPNANGQCSRGRCNQPCSNSDCGPALGAPSWTCEDGTIGGNTGVCARTAAGSCAWEFINCPRACTNSECGPAPGAPNYQCPDGTTAGPICRRSAAGQCGWDFVQCPSTPCTTANGTNACPNGQVCDPNTNTCVPSSVQCGSNTCGAGEFCCNESCGFCAPLGGTCTEQACNGNCANGTPCPTGYSCDSASGQCIEDRTACGPNTCATGQTCCNASCGICVGPNESCSAEACETCADGTICPQGHSCSNTSAGTAGCVPNNCDAATDCGPAPGIPNWTCEDGSVGGPTGRCLRDAANGQCGWEINWCTPACTNADCGAPPGNNTTCPDGTVPASDCQRTAAGNCAWVTQGC